MGYQGVRASASLWAQPALVGLPDPSSNHSCLESDYSSPGLKQSDSSCCTTQLCQPLHIGICASTILSLSLQHPHTPHPLIVTTNAHTIKWPLYSPAPPVKSHPAPVLPPTQHCPLQHLHPHLALRAPALLPNPEVHLYLPTSLPDARHRGGPRAVGRKAVEGVCSLFL